MPASPWPIPGVSTITRSNPAALQASITPARASGTSPRDERVASDRKKTFGTPIEFMRMRSPSSAPPPFLRVGSTAMIGDAQLVLLVATEPVQQLVGE